ncbi:MAG: integrin alpha, partial [Myxococcota bacterium]
MVAFVAAACGDDAVGATGSDPAPTEVTTGADDGGTTGGAASDTGADEGSTTGGVVASTGTPDDDSSGGADDTASSTGAEVPCPDVPYSVIAGTEPGAAAGRTVAFVGDMDGDGIEDFAVAEPAADHGGAVNSGRVYVVAGQSDAYLDFGLADVGGTRPGWVIEGEGPDHAAGTAVYGAQDVNGDGAADLLVGSPGASAGGRWSVVFGGLAADAGAIALHDIRMGSGGFAVDVAPDSSTILPGGGAGVGDFNDDGFADVLVGAPAVENLLGPSFADIIFGRDDGIDVLVLDGEPLPAADGVSYTRQGLSVGLRVAGGGDFDGDGIPDAVFSGPGELSYLARGGATVSSSTVEQLAASDAGLQIDASLDPLSYLSAGSLVVLGDVNDDGRADLGVPLRKNAFQETGDPSGIAVVF